jgi:hypothetical protein
MADATTLIKSPTESMKSFNTRLRAACKQAPVTSGTLAVVDGQPEVTLFSSTDIADEESVNEGLADNVGDEFLVGAPIMIAICRVGARTERESNKTEERLEVIYEKAEGEVDDEATITVTGPAIEFFKPDDDPRSPPIPVQTHVHYKAVIWNHVEEDDDDKEEGRGTDDDTEDDGDDGDARGSDQPDEESGEAGGQEEKKPAKPSFNDGDEVGDEDGDEDGDEPV